MSKVHHLFKSKVSGGGKRKYGKLSLEKKIEIIKAAEMGYSQRALASRYKCGKTQIHLLVTSKEMWLDKWERYQNGKCSDDSHHLTEVESTSFNDLNDLVLDFYTKLTSTGIPVSGSMLQVRAAQVAKELDQPDFVADHDWLVQFVSLYDIGLCENDDINLTLLKTIGSRIKDDAFVENYDLCDIYNMSEVRLPYKFVPSDSNCNKPSTSKDYLTVSLCFNAVGGKESELVVYDHSQLGNFNIDLHSQCVSNWKGIMTQTLYEKRISQLNVDMARLSRHVLLLVDESKYSGSIDCTLSNVKVKPTSICLQSQPILCGVGHMFKFLYLRRLLRMLLAHLTVEGNFVEIVETLPLNKAVSLIQSAWDDLHPRTIQNSFLESGLKHFRSGSEELNEVSESDEALILEIKNLIGLVHKQSASEELSDELFTQLIEESFCTNSISDYSDSEDETHSQSLPRSSFVNACKSTHTQNAQPLYSIDKSNIVNIPDIRSLINNALPSMSRLDSLAGLICNGEHLHKVKILLNELEGLFEDAIADYKLKNNSNSSE